MHESERGRDSVITYRGDLRNSSPSKMTQRFATTAAQSCAALECRSRVRHRASARLRRKIDCDIRAAIFGAPRLSDGHATILTF